MAGDPAELGLLRVNFRTTDPDALAAFKAAFLADGTDEEFLTFLNTFQPDENLDAGASTNRARAAPGAMSEDLRPPGRRREHAPRPAGPADP
ncbi:hypothetical protein SPURM210S_06597 [Streptomyces purpurascens]